MKAFKEKLRAAYAAYAHALEVYTETKDIPVGRRDNSHGDFYKNLAREKEAMLDAKRELESLLE
jgi:hypothetical protein